MRSTTILTTRRLRLRTWKSSDAKLYAKYCNTEEVMEYLGGVMTLRQLKLDLRYFERQQARNGFTFWVLERKRDKPFLGFCGLIRVNEPSSTIVGEVEIGWRIRSDMWRRGYAHEAAVAVMAHAFEQLQLQRVVARVAPGNLASRGLMQKLGMRRLPEFDYVHPSDRMPLITYGIGRSAWKV